MLRAVDRLGYLGSPSHEALTRTVFIFQSALVHRVDLPDLSVELDLRWDLLGLAREDMVWQILEPAEGWMGWLECRVEIYPPEVVAALAEAWTRLLDRVTQAPSARLSAFLQQPKGVDEKQAASVITSPRTGGSQS